MSRSKGLTLIKDIFIFAVGSIGSKLILFLLVPLYTNYMTTEEYGTADLVFTVSQLLVPFVSVVIFDAVVRFGLTKSEKSENVLLCAFVVLGAGTVLTVALTPLLRFYPAISEWKWYFCIYTVLNMVLPVEMNYLKVRNKNSLYAAGGITQTLILAILNIILLTKFHMGVKGYLISNIVAGAIVAIILFFVGGVGKALRKAVFSKKLLFAMTAFSAPLILNNISWWAIHSSNKLMIELMLSASALGIYTVATKIPSLINVFISIFSQAWGISSIKEAEDGGDKSFYSEVMTVYSTLAFTAATVLILIIKPFMSLYVGDDFRSAWQYVPFLLVSAVFNAVSSFYGSIYSALKKSKNNMMTTLIAAVVNIGLNFVFIRIYGIWGAVIGTVAAYIVIAVARIVDIQRFVKIRINWVVFAANCVIILLQAAAVSFEWHGYTVSAVSAVLILLLNGKLWLTLVKKIMSGGKKLLAKGKNK